LDSPESKSTFCHSTTYFDFMKRLSFLLLVITYLLVASSCQEVADDKSLDSTDTKSLKATFQEDFFIGAAINKKLITGQDSIASDLLAREFNSITPENIMKAKYIHPTKDTFFFDHADQFVALGEKNDQFVVGHTLVWHNQLSNWMKALKDADSMEMALEQHIQTIVGRYKGRIDGWDVVNEALKEDGTLRESVFWQTMGPDYLPKVFAMATETDPEAELYYNDYNMCHPKKRAGAIELVRAIQKSGAKIDGIGCQAHWKLQEPSLEEIEKSILAFSDLGLKVMFTELDITVLPNPWDLEGAEVSQNYEGSPFMNPYPEALPDSVQIQLTERYEAIFKLFLKHQDKISRVTFWGISDGNSWLNNWPIKGRTNYPLLFDRNFASKLAYRKVIDTQK
ncbi:MAG: endo-1,4-beta-xylanase, partial [Bacteroidota bacterium]